MSAEKIFSATFVSYNVQNASVTYVWINVFSALSSAIEVVISNVMRVLNKSDVPLLINSVKVIVNIALNLLIVFKFHVDNWTLNINMQADIHLSCDMIAAVSGLLYFFTSNCIRMSQWYYHWHSELSSFWVFFILLKPGIIIFIESVIQNMLYLWLVAEVVAMSAEYITAWKVFTTIQWELIMILVQALKATSLTFIEHYWE